MEASEAILAITAWQADWPVSPRARIFALLVDVHDAEADASQRVFLDQPPSPWRRAHVIPAAWRRSPSCRCDPCQHHDVPGTVVTDDVDVLVDGVCGAAIPVHLVHRCWADGRSDELVHLLAQEKTSPVTGGATGCGTCAGSSTTRRMPEFNHSWKSTGSRYLEFCRQSGRRSAIYRSTASGGCPSPRAPRPYSDSMVAVLWRCLRVP